MRRAKVGSENDVPVAALPQNNDQWHSGGITRLLAHYEGECTCLIPTLPSGVRSMMAAEYP